ncbi:hypothetical protein KC19_10G073100 [Ceratodon purpureus]|uniref:Protein kinase domain-containing protein n=1 Tax=Ceratodon purpureus TaxID=3225 RepID=A0A8T0GPV9_CERPU|nr:hypothetical protein KC19_N044600 [Ceratodon purpureus]KAG0559032.1 hypothetical protein KC19_10G073100 [Ceratodon purpureus]
MAGTSGCSRQLEGLKLNDTSCATSGADESDYVMAPPSEAHPASASVSFLSAGSESIMKTAETERCSAGTMSVAKEADHTTTSSGFVSAVEEQIERSKTHWSTLADGRSGAGMAEDEDGEGDSEAEESNKHEFVQLQGNPTWGHFFNTFGYELENGRYPSQGELVVGEKFAEGGQAELFHAKVTWSNPRNTQVDEREGREYVVKVFKKGTFLIDLKSQLPHGLLQFHVEYMENYKSPAPKEMPRYFCHVVRGILLENGRFAFLMQKDDFDLRSLIERKMESRIDGDCGPFSKEDGEVMMYDIALGVEWLHNRDIIHRDLKASNVLVKEYKSTWPKWVCFVADYECSIGVVGTGFFRAPEILQACKDRMASQRPEVFSRAADVYAYGMTCFEVLTGKLPFGDHPLINNKPLLTDLVINQGLCPEIPEFVEGWARELLKWCWQCDPSARPTIKEILDLLLRNSAFLRRREKDQKERFGDNFRYIPMPLCRIGS